MRVSLPEYDALTDTNPDHFALYADEDWVLIKEKDRDVGTCAQTATETIPHDLDYIPFYLCYVEVAADRYRVASYYDAIGSGWQVYTDTSNLYVSNNYDATYTDFRYYIFYDDIET